LQVKDIMTKEVKTCTPETSLLQVARLMWTGGVGAIPVIDKRGHVAGVITDRDVSMALVNTGRKPGQISAWEAMSRTVHGCGPEDHVQAALGTMKRFRVRRLPVVSDAGLVCGILSMDDIVVRALEGDRPTSAEILDTIREILVYRNIAHEPEAVS